MGYDFRWEKVTDIKELKNFLPYHLFEVIHLNSVSFKVSKRVSNIGKIIKIVKQF